MKLNYRPEIDGLRAIAVVAVILYHADITIFGHNLFKGGFLGVDIFFVISGYLITSLILKELEATGNFSFLHFAFLAHFETFLGRWFGWKLENNVHLIQAELCFILS